MSLTLASYVLGSHGFFFRNGDAYTVPEAGTCGRLTKPGATDPAWVDLGILGDCVDSLTEEEEKIYAATPGRKRLWDIITTQEDLTLKIKTREFGPLTVEQLYRTLKLTEASTQFNPLSGTRAARKGWLKLQRYDQDDNLVLVLDVFVRLKISGDVNYAKLIEAEFEANVLHSPYNTGTL